MTDLDRSLVEQAHQLRSLTEHPGWQILREIVEEAARKKTTLLLSPNERSMDEHRWLAGFVSATRWLLQLADEYDRKLTLEAARTG